MIDVKKFIGLTPEEREVLKALAALNSEAEDAANLIPITWTFEIKVNEIDTTSYTPGLGCKNCLTHGGEWIVLTPDYGELEVDINQETIYELFSAQYLVSLSSTDDEGLNRKAALSSYFRYFWDATKKKAGRTEG